MLSNMCIILRLPDAIMCGICKHQHQHQNRIYNDQLLHTERVGVVVVNGCLLLLLVEFLGEMPFMCGVTVH